VLCTCVGTNILVPNLYLNVTKNYYELFFFNTSLHHVSNVYLELSKSTLEPGGVPTAYHSRWCSTEQLLFTSRHHHIPQAVLWGFIVSILIIGVEKHVTRRVMNINEEGGKERGQPKKRWIDWVRQDRREIEESSLLSLISCLTQSMTTDREE
jgi:hypothetical protein